MKNKTAIIAVSDKRIRPSARRDAWGAGSPSVIVSECRVRCDRAVGAKIGGENGDKGATGQPAGAT